MVLIGMLRKYKNPLVKDTVATMFAKEYQAKVIFFTASQIDFDQKVIHGQNYEYGQWVEDISYFPDVVYNDIPLKKDAHIYKQLEEEGIPFTTHRLGKSKMDFQEAMAKNPYMSKFMIETLRYKGIDSLKESLNKHNVVFMKPNRGHKGLGITVFEKIKTGIKITNAIGLETVVLEGELESYLKLIKEKEHHHLQPGINSVTPNGNSFVIRSYVGRNGQGKWILFFHYASVSNTNSKIVNVSIGSSVSYIAPFLESVYGQKNAKIIKERLSTVAIKIAKETQDIVTPTIDALGIDFGVNKKGEIYIIEVNAFPGTRPFEAGVEKQAIPYVLFLAKNHHSMKKV